MSLENSLQRTADKKLEKDTFVSASDDVTLGVNDRVVHITGFSGAVAVTLPDVASAAGLVFAIKVLDDSSVNNITIQDNDESRSWSDLTIGNASGGKAVLYSDGESWHTLDSTNVT